MKTIIKIKIETKSIFRQTIKANKFYVLIEKNSLHKKENQITPIFQGKDHAIHTEIPILVPTENSQYEIRRVRCLPGKHQLNIAPYV